MTEGPYHQAMRSVAAALGVWVILGAAPGGRQTAPPQTPPASPQQQPPVFRSAVDVIQLDVSVLDKDRRPVRGLTAADFTVFENGKPQSIVAISEMNTFERDVPLTSWMRHVPRDVSANDLTDAIGEGRLVAIVMDDVNMPFDATDIILGAKEVGREILSLLGPSDLAAVVHARDAGKSQDFTDDRDKLALSIEKYEPHPITWMPMIPSSGVGRGGADMPYRTSTALNQSNCTRRQPTIAALDTVTARVAALPKRRKTILFISPGVPLTFTGRNECDSALSDAMRDVFRKAQRANVNIYGIDPAGAGGLENYYMERNIKLGRMDGVSAQRAASSARRLLHDFLEITAEETGARALTASTSLGADIEQIFDEASFYYIVGYQSSNTKLDGKFRRIDVKVNRPGVEVRTRSGYWGARDGKFKLADQGEAPPSTLDLGYSGLMSAPGLALRLAATPVVLAPSTNSAAGAVNASAVALVVSVRSPAPRTGMDETLTLITHVYDADGRVGPPVRQIVTRRLEPGPTDDVRYDVLMRMDLAPGRHEIRVNARSAALDRSGSVYGTIEVPDFTRGALTLSGIVFGTALAEGAVREDALAALVPVVPTSVRDFAPADRITTFLRIYQGVSRPLVPVTVSAQILDSLDKTVFEATETIGAEAFAAGRSAPYQMALPVPRLAHGPHLLSIRVSADGVPPVRRDVVFRVQ